MVQYHYWPGLEPEGHAKAMLIKPFLPEEDESYPHPDLETLRAWTEANGWTTDKQQCVVIANSDWQSQPSYYMVRQPDDATGQVTVENVAEFILSGMETLDRVLSWWSSYLIHLTNLGYKFIVIGDWEMGFTTGWKFRYQDHPEISMLEVITYMRNDPVMSEKVPRVQLEDLLEPNHYGVPKNEQAHSLWNAWVTQTMYNKLTEVFVTNTADRFSNVVSVSNYNCQDAPPNCDLRSWPHGTPIAKPAMGVSGPLLYLSDDTKYTSNADAMAAFSTVVDPAESVPWVGNPNRNSGGWLQSQEQFDELNAWLEEQGVQTIMVF